MEARTMFPRGDYEEMITRLHRTGSKHPRDVFEALVRDAVDKHGEAGSEHVKRAVRTEVSRRYFVRLLPSVLKYRRRMSWRTMHIKHRDIMPVVRGLGLNENDWNNIRQVEAELQGALDRLIATENARSATAGTAAQPRKARAPNPDEPPKRKRKPPAAAPAPHPDEPQKRKRKPPAAAPDAPPLRATRRQRTKTAFFEPPPAGVPDGAWSSARASDGVFEDASPSAVADGVVVVVLWKQDDQLIPYAGTVVSDPGGIPYVEFESGEMRPLAACMDAPCRVLWDPAKTTRRVRVEYKGPRGTSVGYFSGVIVEGNAIMCNGQWVPVPDISWF